MNQQNFLQQKLNELITENLNVQDLIKRFERAKKNRISWEKSWAQIQDQVLPDYNDFYNQSGQQTSTPRKSKIKTHSGIISGKINKVVSILSSQISDPSVSWLELKFGVKSLNEAEVARRWLYQCKEALYAVFSDPSSNFYPSTFSFHSDWFTLGTACREIILRRDNGKLRFNTISMKNIYVEESGYGDLNIIYRVFSVTPSQAYDLWGDALHPSQIKQAKEHSTGNTTAKNYEYIEISMPNPLLNIDLPIEPLQYITCVIDKTNKMIVDIQMHHQSPYVVSRFLVAPGETYGRSYVWYAMPDMLTINLTAKRIIQGIDYAMFPVNLVKDEDAISQLQLTPGAFVPGLDFNGNQTIKQLPSLANPQVGIEYYNLKVNELDDVLVARDIFPAETPNMTATEVNERKIQANNRIRPLLVRLEAEDLNNTVRRTLALLQQQGELPPFPYEELDIMPEELPNPLEQLNVQFSGQMAKMQRLQEIVNNDAILQKTIQVAQIDPSVLDRINLDSLIVEDAKIYGTNPTVMNDEKTVQDIRESRAQAQQEKEQTEQEAIALDNLVKIKEAGIATDQLTNH